MSPKPQTFDTTVIVVNHKDKMPIIEGNETIPETDGHTNLAYYSSSIDVFNYDEICLKDFRKLSAISIDHRNQDKKGNTHEAKEATRDQFNSSYEPESWKMVLRQMWIPFLIAGFGSVFAGIVLNAVTQWSVFHDVPQLEIMVPAFLGLIGNIQTTLASRLSTAANLGILDCPKQLVSILWGNLLIVQCQAPILGMFAACASLAISSLNQRTRTNITWEHTLLLASGSVLTSIVSNTLLSATISAVIVASRKLKLNPDNISIPVAASMGDVCSIAILAVISQKMYDLKNQYFQMGLILAFIAITPIYGYFARINRFSKSVIVTGWAAILGAVIVEQPGGMVMQSAFERYKVLSTFQPLVNGIGSNLVGIQTSRMSTFLHSVSKKGQLPESNSRYCVGPFWVFFSNDIHAQMARLLMLVVVPAHLFYMTFIYLVQTRFSFSLILTFPFVSTYCLAVIIQLTVLLYLAYVSVFWAWSRKINPDNSAIPFTSALADVLGNFFMAAAFTFLKWINDPNVQLISDDINDQYQSCYNCTTSTVLSLTMTTTTTLKSIPDFNHTLF